MTNKPQPADFEIHAPRDWRFSDDVKGFQIWVESAIAKQRYHLLLQRPMFTSGNLGPARAAELSNLIANECSLVSVYLQRNAVEFHAQDHFICGVHCQGCNVEIVRTPAA